MTLTEKDLENKEVKKVIENDSELKSIIVGYVGNKLNPEDGRITLQNVLEVFASEFPEFILPLAEENFLKGYEQAFVDLDAMAKEEKISLDNTEEKCHDGCKCGEECDERLSDSLPEKTTDGK